MNPLQLTRKQQEVFNRLCQLGAMHFFNIRSASSMSPRLFPLIAAPTGAGKSFLVKQVALRLKAHYFPITYVNWMPQGAKQGQYTLFALLDALEIHPWVVFHLDELDKGVDFDNEWNQSVFNDIWNVLDLRLPVRDWARAKNKGLSELKEFEEKIRNRLWIVGSGTWQMVFEGMHKPAVGFSGNTSKTSESPASRILASRAIPTELTARFHAELLFLTYPEGEQEILSLLDRMGLTRLAMELGESIDPTQIRFEEHGMRVLESIHTSLIMKQFRKKFALSPAGNMDKINVELLQAMTEKHTEASEGKYSRTQPPSFPQCRSVSPVVPTPTHAPVKPASPPAHPLPPATEPLQNSAIALHTPVEAMQDDHEPPPQKPEPELEDPFAHLWDPCPMTPAEEEEECLGIIEREWVHALSSYAPVCPLELDRLADWARDLEAPASIWHHALRAASTPKHRPNTMEHSRQIRFVQHRLKLLEDELAWIVDEYDVLDNKDWNYQLDADGCEDQVEPQPEQDMDREQVLVQMIHYVHRILKSGYRNPRFVQLWYNRVRHIREMNGNHQPTLRCEAYFRGEWDEAANKRKG